MAGEQKYIDVSLFEWAKGRPGEVLETHGLGPCIGVATYDTNIRQGHLGHFPSPYLMPKLLQNFFDSIVDTSPDIKFLKAWVAGGDVLILPPEEGKEEEYDPVDHALKERNEVLEKLASIGVHKSRIEVHWLKSFECANIMLDCTTGQYGLEIEDFSHASDI